ncbi:hypothetical protein O9929_01585 [Vibrio lentus]|nr:hypothetical protein [Vibrio lentus]
MTVEDAHEYFNPVPVVLINCKPNGRWPAPTIRLRPSGSPTLSGGEGNVLSWQESYLNETQEKTLYILDEPTTGLHFHDIQATVNGTA